MVYHVGDERRVSGWKLPNQAVEPACDLTTEFRTSPHRHDQAAVIAGAHVLSHRPGVVALEAWTQELARRYANHACPVGHGGVHIGRLVDRDSERPPFGPNAQELQPCEEQPDQTRVGVCEDHTLAGRPRLAL